MVKNGRVIYVSEPETHIEPDVHVKYVEEDIDLDAVELQKGDVLLRSIYLSSDPYMRYRMRDPQIQMFCPPLYQGSMYVRHSLPTRTSDCDHSIDNTGIAQVLRSNDQKLKPGDIVLGYIGMLTLLLFSCAHC